ncbi:hypothetical protein PVAND_014281 [Polypedilum vanderplanki]|uniref:Uncharacterized protein n=1 Tax=Polypedilum vanderplanki TaxID=319348 RepID=A0A9J6CSX0_POLVA|nr:hypothetical protein PVAND_014281 [Polypedilum vanderplanki]
MNWKILASILIALTFLAESLAQNRKIKPILSLSQDVAQQSNASLYIRGKNEPFEGEGDIEYTKSQEEGLVLPVIAWNKKGKPKKWHVPYKIDSNSNFTYEELTNIQNELIAAEKLLNVTFKTPKHETYVITIRSLKQCAENLLQKIPQPHNEIGICFNAKLEFLTETTRAVMIGMQINKIISDDSSEEAEEDEENTEEYFRKGR